MNEVHPLKDIARQFLLLSATGAINEAYEKFVSDDFIHHNQYFKGDRAALKQAMKDSEAAVPNKNIEIKNILQEGDRVTSYSHVYTADRSLDIAVVHMFRFHNGKIAEMWDVGQHIAKDCPNENGLF